MSTVEKEEALEKERTEISAVKESREWLGYVAPMALFIAFTMLEGYFRQYYVAIYTVKIISVVISLAVYRDTWRDYRYSNRILLPAVLVGLGVYLIWIPVDRITPHFAKSGSRTGYDPFREITDINMRYFFLMIRFTGLALVVPFMEELFWRSFLLRFLSEPDGKFKKLAQGEFTLSAFVIVAAAFALSHPEWLSALICAVAYGLLLRHTRSLTSPFIAHTLTNLLLGITIMHNHVWQYW